MEKLYPIVKFQKWVEESVPENEKHRYTFYTSIFCPVCNRRLPKVKLNPKYSYKYYEYEYRLAKSTNGFVGKPYRCEGCDSMIYPIS